MIFPHLLNFKKIIFLLNWKITVIDFQNVKPIFLFEIKLPLS